MNLIVSALEQTSIEPVLVDVGSSGPAMRVFAPLAPFSTIIGFDADSRGQGEEFAKGFKRSILVPKAVVTDESVEEVEFVLTRNPYCSSTLEPDLDALESFVFQDLFVPVGRAKAPATTLNKVLKDQGLEGFDWVKVDSQGTDLRILRSLEPETFKRLLVVDVEPGLIDAYKGEDLFVDTHAFLVGNGFFLADVHTQSYARLRPSTAREIARIIDVADATPFLKKSPTCCEARYFRTLEHLETHGTKRMLITAFVFGLVDELLGYAFDVALVYNQKFGKDSDGTVLLKIAHEAAASASSTSSTVRSTVAYVKDRLAAANERVASLRAQLLARKRRNPLFKLTSRYRSLRRELDSATGAREALVDVLEIRHHSGPGGRGT